MQGRSGRWIAVTAHHDGLGIGTPDARGDSIYNGAQDNALGVAMALCLARSADRASDIGIVFLFTAAEERGRLGSHHWVTHPTVSRDSVNFALDLDALGVRGPTEDLVAYGSTTLVSNGVLRTVAESAGFQLSEFHFQSAMHFAFDAAEFAGAGVPAVTLGQGARLRGLSAQESFRAMRTLRARYHAPSDELDATWEPRALEQYLAAAQAIVAALRRGEAPALRPGGPYVAMAPTIEPNDGDAAYSLPYAVGTSYRVLQANHGPYGHVGHAEYAYDFSLPLRTPIVATRAGVVVHVVNGFADGNRVPGEENVIVVRHADSTFARYYHLTRNGARRAVGETVAQGDTIALSGDTGASAGPHLHFDVTRGCFAWRCPTLPVRFVKATAEVLQRGEAYVALPRRSAP